MASSQPATSPAAQSAASGTEVELSASSSEPQPDPSGTIQNASSSVDTLEGRDIEDDQSSYLSARSRLSVRSLFTRSSIFSRLSLFTDSTGRQSVNGATWQEAFTKTMQTGFGPGAPRSSGYVGVREGREKGGLLPRIRGVGRTGKGPAPVPAAMLRALGVPEEEIQFRTTARKELEQMKKWILELESEVAKYERLPPSSSPKAGAFLQNIRERLVVLHLDIGRDEQFIYAKASTNHTFDGLVNQYESLEVK